MTNKQNRLPSFTELTSNFHSKLQLPSDEVTPRPHGGSMLHPVAQVQYGVPQQIAQAPVHHRTHQQHQQQQAPPPPPPPPPPQRTSTSIRGSHYQFPRPGQHEQQVPSSFRHPAPAIPESNYSFPVSPLGYNSQLHQTYQPHGPSRPSVSLPQVNVNVQNQPSYIISGPPPLQQQHQRHRSLQMSTYSNAHRKTDSYDSQTSLSTLADIASSSPADLQTLLHSLEKIVNISQHLSMIFQDISYDFRSNMESNFKSGEMLQLQSDYMDQNGNRYHEISVENVSKVLNNIPLPALRGALGMVDDLRTFFDQWVIYRERELASDERGESSSYQKGQRRGKSLGTTRRREGDSTYLNPVTNPKRRKSTSSAKRKEGQNISLVVKPPTPVTTAQASQPRDNLNEELSVRSDQKCQQCGTDDTPEWRRGPYGTRSLCNACGLFYSKLSKGHGMKIAADIMLERRDRGEGDDRRLPHTE